MEFDNAECLQEFADIRFLRRGAKFDESFDPRNTADELIRAVFDGNGGVWVATEVINQDVGIEDGFHSPHSARSWR